MPEHLKALVVILMLAAAVFAFAKMPACMVATRSADFDRRRNLWFCITATAFIAHNFWIYIIVTAVLLAMAVPRESNRLALYFLVLFAVPSISDVISGLGIIKQFFTIHYLRLLALAVLLPAFLELQKKTNPERFGRSTADKLIAGYLLLQFLLMLNTSTFTNSLRYGVFYSYVDIFLPYYVASRSFRDIAGFRDAAMAFVVAALVLSAVAAFEFARHWLLYNPLADSLGVGWHMGKYLQRGEVLRVSGSTGHPIVLGYVMVTAIGLMLFLRRAVGNVSVWRLGLTALAVGLIVPFSRGPWIGAVALLITHTATGPTPRRSFLKLALACALVFPLFLASPFGKDVLDHLSFAGSTVAITEDSVAYRQRLVQIAIQVVLQNPFFGAYDYIYSTALQELKQGEGIIDIVNSYVAIALSSGLVGLSLFAGFFITVLAGIYRNMRQLPDRNDELYELGRALFSVLFCILVIIATVSSIEVIPVIYWSVAGLGAAYARMLSPLPLAGERTVNNPSPNARRGAAHAAAFRSLDHALGKS